MAALEVAHDRFRLFPDELGWLVQHTATKEVARLPAGKERCVSCALAALSLRQASLVPSASQILRAVSQGG